jgi:hypothetical protein
MTMLLEGTDVLLILDELETPGCDLCSGEPRWRITKLCVCGRTALYCNSCHNDLLAFEVYVTLSGEQFHCQACDALTPTMPELLSVLPLPWLRGPRLAPSAAA